MLDVKFTQVNPEDNQYLYHLIPEAEDSKSLDLDEVAIALDAKYNGVVTKAIEGVNNFKGMRGQIKHIHTADDKNFVTIILVGVGKISELTHSKIQDIGGNIAKSLKSLKVKSTSIQSRSLGEYSEESVGVNIAFGLTIGSYSFDKYKTTKKDDVHSIDVSVCVTNKKEADNEFEYFKHIATGIFSARDVVSEPGNILYPESYAKIISDTLEPIGVKVEIIGEAEMRNLGMNALIGVGQGSSKESKLVVMTYNGADDNQAPIALVGKGVTFDTGGISLKPSRNMGDMKYDMGGSATVFGTMLSIASRNDKVNLVGIVGLVENMPGSNAQRPGDVVKSLSGQTIEILDTDAEGRLVLADALWYTQDRFKPKLIIDLATLTGAVTVALGHAYAGLFSNNDLLAEKITEAGNESGEYVWRLPLNEAYDTMIESSIADVANLGSPPGYAGSSTAAQFLQKFVNNVPWAHLDIAGVANSSKDLPIAPKGAVGFGIRLLNKLIPKYYE